MGGVVTSTVLCYMCLILALGGWGGERREEWKSLIHKMVQKKGGKLLDLYEQAKEIPRMSITLGPVSGVNVFLFLVLSTRDIC